MSCALCLGVFAIASPTLLRADPIKVVHKQGSMHGFLLLKDRSGKVIALGDQVNVAKGGRIWSRLVFHFNDGSVDDETTVFRQGSTFQVVSDHHIQKGPSFPDPLDISFDVGSKVVTTRTIRDGRAEVKTDHVDLPPDLSNGIVSAVLESFPAGTSEMKVSYLAATPKPRVVTLVAKPSDEENFLVGGSKRKAIRYQLHVELGGLTGVIAPVLGKEPSDIEVWVASGPVPAFLKLRGALFLKGPIWTMELTSPSWTDEGSTAR